MRVSISSPYRPLAIVVVRPLPRRRGRARGAGACGWHRIRECGSAVPSVGAGLGSDGRWVQHGAADLLDDELQVVHVPGDPGGQFRSVAAELPGGVHRQTDREQLLDDVVTSIPLRFPSILWSGSAWFCTTWHRLSTPGARSSWAVRRSASASGRGLTRPCCGPRCSAAAMASCSTGTSPTIGSRIRGLSGGDPVALNVMSSSHQPAHPGHRAQRPSPRAGRPRS